MYLDLFAAALGDNEYFEPEILVATKMNIVKLFSSPLHRRGVPIKAAASWWAELLARRAAPRRSSEIVYRGGQANMLWRVACAGERRSGTVAAEAKMALSTKGSLLMRERQRRNVMKHHLAGMLIFGMALVVKWRHRAA